MVLHIKEIKSHYGIKAGGMGVDRNFYNLKDKPPFYLTGTCVMKQVKSGRGLKIP